MYQVQSADIHDDGGTGMDYSEQSVHRDPERKRRTGRQRIMDERHGGFLHRNESRERHEDHSGQGNKCLEHRPGLHGFGSHQSPGGFYDIDHN